MAQWLEIEGMSLRGPPPMGAAHLRWNPGLTVLYGKNGAGKTRFLDSLRSCLEGQQPAGGEGLIHVRLVEDAQLIPGPVVGRLLGLDTLPFAIPGPDGGVEWLEAIENSPLWLTELPSFSDPQAVIEYRHVVERFWDCVRARSASVVNDLWDGTVVSAPEDLRTRLGLHIEAAIQHRSLALRPTLDGWEVFLASPRWTVPSLWTGVRAEDWEPPDEYILDDWAGLNLVIARQTAEGDRLDVSDRDDGQLLTPPPEWVSIPVIPLGFIPHDLGPVHVSVDTAKANESTWSLLVGGAKDLASSASFEVIEDERSAMMAVDPGTYDLFDQLGVAANELLASLLLDPPQLRARVLGPSDWLQGRLVAWEAHDPSGSWGPLDRLSLAQRRWAEASIQWVINHPNTIQGSGVDLDRPITVTVDEPELALHPNAIAKLLDGLRLLGGGESPAAVVATSHSPQVIAEAVELHLVTRGIGGKATLVSLPGQLRSDVDEVAADLGVRPVDLLQLVRVFLMVEGRHDEIVLRELIGDDLERVGVHILVLQGAKDAASVANAPLVLTYTDAAIVVLLDNTSPSHLPSRWPEIQGWAADGDWTSAWSALTEIEKEGGLTFEERLALRYCKQSLRSRPDRLHLEGLSKGDIIEYLDPSDFGLQEPWDVLRIEYARYVEAMKNSGGRRRQPDDFKSWLRKGDVTINIATIKEAVQRMDSVPQDITDVLDLCRRLSTMWTKEGSPDGAD